MTENSQNEMPDFVTLTECDKKNGCATGAAEGKNEQFSVSLLVEIVAEKNPIDSSDAKGHTLTF